MVEEAGMQKASTPHDALVAINSGVLTRPLASANESSAVYADGAWYEPVDER
jgi:phage baseplate assembly protein gpV